MSTTPLKKVPDASDPSTPPVGDGQDDPAREAKPKTSASADAGAKPAPIAAAKPKEVKPAPVAEVKAKAKPKEVKPAPVAEVKAKAEGNAKEKGQPADPATAAKAQVVKATPPAAPQTPPEAKPEEPRPTPPGPSSVPREPVRDAAAAVRSLRKARARRLGLRVALGVGLPTLLASIYFFLIASPQYESVSLFTVQSAEARGGFGLETLLGVVPGASGARDTLAVRDFITSRDMLDALERRLKIREHYQNPARDWWARLDGDAKSEDAYDYYREMVQVDHDSNSGVVTLRVRAFSPEFAKKVAEAVLSESEKMVNQLSERARLDQTKVARSEVANAEARLTKARQAIVALQRDHSEFNPQMTASEAFTLRGTLKAELAKARAELMEARAFMQPDAPKVISLEERVKSLSAQVSEESQRLVSTKGTSGLGSTMADFDAAMVEKEFAQGAYQSALASLEVARTEAARQHRYLATVAKPSMPNDETHPKRLRGVITVVLLSAMLLGMIMLLVEAIREHARI